ncbi:unnamed protein product [Symbiodinium sp. CCMP2456]|nr:unnamed protein product [Symbiodinium sp. CCMP2456]
MVGAFSKPSKPHGSRCRWLTSKRCPPTSASSAVGTTLGLIYLLDQISKMFGSQLFLGEEFLTAITFVDFKDAESRYPFLKAALWACQLHSPKHHDSISRLLSKTDVEKLKTAAVKQTVKNAEQLLKMSWDILEKPGWLNEKKGVGLIARFMIRVALFVCNKSGKGREPHVYETLADVHAAFSQELEAVKKGHDPAKAPGAGSSSSAVGSPAKRIKDNSSAAAIALRQHSWLKVGGRYSRKDCTDIHVFEAMTDHVARFRVVDPWGQEKEVEVLHADLKGMKATEKMPPTILDQGLVATLGLSSFKGLYSEVSHALYEHYQQPFGLKPKSLSVGWVAQNELDESWLHYSSDNKIYAAKNIKKGGLKLYPVGFLVRSQSDERDKGKAIVKHSDSGFKFVVQPPRVELEAGKSCLVPYFWVQPSAGESNMEHGETAIAGKSIVVPFLKNKAKLVAGEQLLFERLPAGANPGKGAKRKA